MATAAIVNAIQPADADKKGLSDLYQQAARRLSRSGSSEQIARAVEQVVRLERISSEAKRVLDVGRDAQIHADELIAELQAFNTDNKAPITAGPTAAPARAAQDQFSALARAMAQLQAPPPPVANTHPPPP